MLVVGYLEEMHRSTGQTSPVLGHFFCYQLHPVAEYEVKLGHRMLFSTNCVHFFEMLVVYLTYLM